MRRVVGKGLQALGLVVVPSALYYGVELGSLSLELAVMTAGAMLFVVGRLIDPAE